MYRDDGELEKEFYGLETVVMSLALTFQIGGWWTSPGTLSPADLLGAWSCEARSVTRDRS